MYIIIKKSELEAAVEVGNRIAKALGDSGDHKTMEELIELINDNTNSKAAKIKLFAFGSIRITIDSEYMKEAMDLYGDMFVEALSLIKKFSGRVDGFANKWFK